MPTDRSDKPSRTVQLETGMAMTFSCSPARDQATSPDKPDPARTQAQQRGNAK